MFITCRFGISSLCYSVNVLGWNSPGVIHGRRLEHLWCHPCTVRVALYYNQASQNDVFINISINMLLNQKPSSLTAHILGKLIW